MRHVLGLPFMIHPLIPEFLTQQAVAEVAQAAEAAGFAAVAVTEHPIPSGRDRQGKTTSPSSGTTILPL